jgi:hypothetical protein
LIVKELQMKKTIRWVLFTGCLSWLPFAHAASSPLAGTWKATIQCSKKADSSCQPEFFAIRLFVRGGEVCGKHSSVAMQGNKVDEMDDSEPSLTGTMDGSIAKISFNSAFGGSGWAQVSSTGKTLNWRITKDDGVHYLPPKVTLQRVRSGQWGSKLSCG